MSNFILGCEKLLKQVNLKALILSCAQNTKFQNFPTLISGYSIFDNKRSFFFLFTLSTKHIFPSIQLSQQNETVIWHLLQQLVFFPDDFRVYVSTMYISSIFFFKQSRIQPNPFVQNKIKPYGRISFFECTFSRQNIVNSGFVEGRLSSFHVILTVG